MGKIRDYLSINKKRIKIIVISTIIWGILAHGSTMFNLYSFFDNSDLFNIGATYELGRWFLGFMAWLTMYFNGSLLYTTPLLNTALTIICIGIISYTISDLFEIKSHLLLILLNGLMIAFPAVTSALGYMFTAPYYYVGLLLGIIGIYAFFKNKKWYTWLIATVLLTCGAGTYQANMHLFVGIILLLTIKETHDNNYSLKSFVVNSLINVTLCVGMLAFYLIINEVVLKLLDVSMAEYKNVSSLSDVPISEYVNRIFLAYKEFFFPTNNISRNMYVFSLFQFYKILLFVFIAILLFILIKSFKKNKLRTIELIILFIFVPLANNFVYLMCEIEFVYSIMMYGQLTFFILFIYMIENMKIDMQIVYKGTKLIGIVLLCVFCAIYTKFDNDCYLKADILQKQIDSYATTMVTQIKSLNGYKDGMKIAYINKDNKHDFSIPQSKEMDSIYVHPYHMSTLLEDYNLNKIIKRQIGFSLEEVDSEWLKTMDEVKNMSCYPDAGSIIIVEDVIVIKFSE